MFIESKFQSLNIQISFLHITSTVKNVYLEIVDGQKVSVADTLFPLRGEANSQGWT